MRGWGTATPQGYPSTDDFTDIPFTSTFTFSTFFLHSHGTHGSKGIPMSLVLFLFFFSVYIMAFSTLACVEA